jgi:hypothetical protein
MARLYMHHREGSYSSFVLHRVALNIENAEETSVCSTNKANSFHNVNTYYCDFEMLERSHL